MCFKTSLIKFVDTDRTRRYECTFLFAYICRVHLFDAEIGKPKIVPRNISTQHTQHTQTHLNEWMYVKVKRILWRHLMCPNCDCFLRRSKKKQKNRKDVKKGIYEEKGLHNQYSVKKETRTRKKKKKAIKMEENRETDRTYVALPNRTFRNPNYLFSLIWFHLFFSVSTACFCIPFTTDTYFIWTLFST